MTQKAEQDLEAFKAKLVEMTRVMTSLEIDSKEKDMRCHVLEKALDKAADQSAADLKALHKTAEQSAADLETLQKQAKQSAADLEALEKTADESAAVLKALQKQADQSAADLESQQKAKTEELKECQEQIELLQQELKRQAEKRCQSQETQTEVVQSCPGPKLILCVHRNKPSNMSCNAYWSVNPACSLVYWGRCVIYFVFFRNVSAKRRKRRVAA